MVEVGAPPPVERTGGFMHWLKEIQGRDRIEIVKLMWGPLHFGDYQVLTFMLLLLFAQ